MDHFKYRPVDTRVWNDREFCSLSTEAKLLWLFLLTAPISLPIPGVIVGGEGALSEALGWPLERFRERFAELFAKRLGIRFDLEARLVWLPNAIKRWPPANPNVVKGWGATWQDVPECELKHEIWCALKESCKRFPEPFAERFNEPVRKGLANGSGNGLANGYPNGSGNGYPNGLANQEQEQDQKQETSAGDLGDPVTVCVTQPVIGPARLTVEIWTEHCIRHERLREELGLKQKSRPMLRAGGSTIGWRDLRARIDAYGSELELAREDCLHVLGVREAEARSKKTVEWFGDRVWREDQFSRAKDTPAPKPKLAVVGDDWVDPYTRSPFEDEDEA